MRDALNACLFPSPALIALLLRAVIRRKIRMQKKESAAWLERLDRWSENRLLPPTVQVMREWGRLCARQQRKGRRLPVLDSLIAATAPANNLVLVTRNTTDYRDEVPLINPWNQ